MYRTFRRIGFLMLAILMFATGIFFEVEGIFIISNPVDANINFYSNFSVMTKGGEITGICEPFEIAFGILAIIMSVAAIYVSLKVIEGVFKGDFDW